MKKGTKVVFTRGPLGGMNAPNSARFAGTVQKGDAGLYDGKHPLRHLAKECWSIVKVLRDGDQPLYVPVHDSQYRKEPTP